VECELSDPTTCDGFCPDPNDVCTPGSTTPILPSPDLPPNSNPPGTTQCEQILEMYVGEDVHALFPGGIDFSDPQHKCFLNVNRDDDGSGNEIEIFDSTVDGQVDLGSGPVPVALTGPVTIVTYGKTGHTTGTFATEMVSMSLTGDVGGVPIEIRESPSLQSAGQTTITDLGGGLWAIDSFFDVFTELSVNGGPFEPQTNGPGRMTLVPTNPNPCECRPVPCEQSDPTTCGGDCPIAGDICTIDPAGGPCFCAPPPLLCGDSFGPECEGACPPDERCTETDAGLPCECVPCIAVVPGPVKDVLFHSKIDFDWQALPCAVVYNVYRLTATGLVDADGDGLADGPWPCFQPALGVPQTADASNPPPSWLHYYLITGKNGNGEGTMGWNSNSQERPNLTPCP
jgi:hypothetical protein